MSQAIHGHGKKRPSVGDKEKWGILEGLEEGRMRRSGNISFKWVAGDMV